VTCFWLPRSDSSPVSQFGGLLLFYDCFKLLACLLQANKLLRVAINYIIQVSIATQWPLNCARFVGSRVNRRGWWIESISDSNAGA